MVTTSFKKLVIPTIIVPQGKVHGSGASTPADTVSTSDLNKTHFVINALQTNVDNALKPVLANPIVSNSKVLPAVALFAGKANVIDHMLGQTLQGWMISRPTSPFMPWEDASQPNLDKQIVIWTYIDTITDIVVW